MQLTPWYPLQVYSIFTYSIIKNETLKYCNSVMFLSNSFSLYSFPVSLVSPVPLVSPLALVSLVFQLSPVSQLFLSFHSFHSFEYLHSFFLSVQSLQWTVIIASYVIHFASHSYNRHEWTYTNGLRLSYD